MASGDVWVCDGCETNNPGDRTTCRTCQRRAGSTTDTTVLSAPSSGTRPRRVEEAEPDFQVHSGYERQTRSPSRVQFTGTGSPRPLYTLPAPPPPPPPPPVIPRPVAPPRPAYAPPPPARRTPTPRIPKPAIVFAVLFALFVLGKVSGLGDGPPGGGFTSSSPATTGAPCPTAAAVHLPSGSAGSSLVAKYQTPKHVITVCRGADGRYRYDGQVKGQSASGDFHISLPAEETTTGFTARNLDYVYEIRGAVVIVTRGGEEISRADLEPVP